MSSVYVARQPIFEVGRGLYGYELLYRRDISIDHADGDDAHMSADVIANALLAVGISNISGGRLAFVNFSRGQLLDRSWELFDPEPSSSSCWSASNGIVKRSPHVARWPVRATSSLSTTLSLTSGCVRWSSWRRSSRLMF